MYFHEMTYDIDILARQNLHIHTTFSGCAKAEMTVDSIIDTAVNAGLEMIALTDHFNTDNTNEQCIERNLLLRQQAEQKGGNLKILFSNELSCYGIGKTLENDKVRQAMDYNLYTCNHYHLDYWEQPEDKSARGYAVHTHKMISSIIKSGFADCIAHPIMAGYVRTLKDDVGALSRAMTDNELGSLLELAAANEVAFEINIGAVGNDPELAKRMWALGKEIGTYFNFGTDAHRLENIDTRALATLAKKLFE
ncbi:MAG TPA: PHP domain-containing protein [Clostridia bacterium]|nr:PHP domain-containing protein [Clostridia bacterium]